MQSRIWVRRLCTAAIGLLVAALAVWLAYLAPLPQPLSSPAPQPIPAPFSHVVLIVMENQGQNRVLNNPAAPYLHQLAQTWGYDPDYYGVTHPSLPNYVAMLTGRTFGSHSDNPTQRFSGPSLVDQLEQHHISWQAVMESLPAPGYQGNWYPPGNPARPTAMPIQALYAKKHDPFLLLRSVAESPRARAHVVPLSTFAQELDSGQLPQFVFLVPNLCHDMHGQPNAAGASCPASRTTELIAAGDRFLATWIPRILHSKGWQGNAVIFITWDETDYPGGWPTPGKVRRYFLAGPEAPAVWGIPWLGRVGGGLAPLLILAREGPHPLVKPVWADHYALLKTIEAAWHLPYLGHAASAQVPTLGAFLKPSSAAGPPSR
ncbi:MAG: alkaline phosphatase family protein [Firmicutes bacterium]|nr:alkaline phosphatase family protein [Bacillota bacterium]